MNGEDHQQIPIKMRKMFDFGPIMTSPVIAVATGDVASNRRRVGRKH